MVGVRQVAGRLLRALPEHVAFRLAPGRLGYTSEDIPAPLTVAGERARFLVAPANFAAQGYEWARSAETLSGVGAFNLEVSGTADYQFASDGRVSAVVFERSRTWARAHAAAVREQVTHILIEAERPVLGMTVGRDPLREALWLDRAGVQRGYVSHGSDLRMPRAHADRDPWSPFRDVDPETLAVQEELVAANGRFLREQQRPVFVSTPDLLVDFPDATWLPVVVDGAQWASTSAVLERARPIVVHSPTSATLKGSHLIEETLRRLHEREIIDYRFVNGVAHGEMPALYDDADIVLEQFRLGSYGRTAIEAMAAGRVVIGHVSSAVRSVVSRATGRDLPLLQATPDTLEELLLDTLADRDNARAHAAAGPDFVSHAHGRASAARVLAPFLGVAAESSQAVNATMGG